MNVRVEVLQVGAGMEVEGSSWTPELAETLLRMCADQVLRICKELGIDELTADEVSAGDDESGVVDSDD